MSRIPKRFNIFGHTINVEYVSDLQKRDGCHGQFDTNTLVIQLQSRETANSCESQQEQTFYHELVHAIFHLTGYEDLDKDEQLVDLIGQCLHQVAATSELE